VQNPITWFEIPASDFDRAVKFYSDVLRVEVRKENFMGIPNGMFPYDEGRVGGAIVLDPQYTPSDKGAVIYLNTRGDLDGALTRVEAAGGKALTGKLDIGPAGFVAYILDTEGNKVGLHDAR
jgi:predicted enzyme related to lactoylglutathione lyase